MKKIFLFLIVGIFLFSMISTVSAELTTFDNVKSYDQNTKTVTIKNLFGLGQTYADIQLTTDCDGDGVVDLNCNVPRGYQKVAEFKVTGYVDYKDFIKELEFYNLRDKENKINRDFDLKIKGSEQVLIDDFSLSCSNKVFANGTIGQDCEKIKIGSHYETKETWTKLTPADLKKNNQLIIGIFTDVKKGDKVDWIPNFAGVKVEEWATWTESLNVDLVSYYKFDEGSGVVIDSAGNYNLTNYGATNTTGKIGSAYSFNNDNGDYIKGVHANITTSTPYSIGCWFYINSIDGGGDYILDNNFNAQPYAGGIYYNGGGGEINYATSTGVWTFWTWVDDGSVLKMFKDASNVVNGTTGTTGATEDLVIGNRNGLDRATDGKVDECFFYTRALSDAEVVDFYNGGDGITWEQLTSPSGLNISLNYPENYYNSTLKEIDFNTTVIDNFNVENVTLYIDGVLNETNTSTVNGTYIFSKILSDGGHNWSIFAFDNESYSLSSATWNFTVNTTPNIQFEDPTPIDQYNSTIQYLPVNVTVTEDYFLNISFDFYKDGVLTRYDYTDGTRYINESFAQGIWEYNVTVWTTTEKSNTTATRTWNYDATPPVISGTGNLTDLNTLSLPINSTWNFTISDDNLDQCWYSNDSFVTNYSITCSSYINTTWVTEGNKTLNYCGNDTFGFETCATSYIWVYLLSYTQSDTPDPIAEGFDATFNFTINRTNIPTTTATLVLNNTVYVPSSTANTNSYEFGVTVTIPDTWGNTTGILQDWYWNYTIDGVVTNQNTNTSNITVYELAIDDCSSYGEIILDVSFLDEETKTAINESNGANFEIDLQLTSKDDQSVYLQYNNTWTDDNNPQVCIPLNVLNNSEYWIDFTIGFQATDHVWEFYYLDDGTLNSTKIFNSLTRTPFNVFDLLTADSTSFLFNYFDQDGLPVDDIIVHVYRKYIGDGTFNEVERAKADLNGDTIVHLVEEDVIYYFVISQYGEILFTSSQYTALCQATPCQIQLEASGTGATFGTDWDLIDGGAYTLQDNPSTRVVNLTYSLNASSTMNLTIYKYNSDGSYSSVASGSDTGSSGSVLVTVPQGAGNVSFFATVYQDDDFVNSEWVDFEEKAQDRFGVTLALFIGALIILSLGLMAITEGVGTLVFVILGVALSGFLGLVTTQLSTGVNIVVYLVVAGGILLWKLTGGRR